jgi:type I restriction enzyme M protein
MHTDSSDQPQNDEFSLQDNQLICLLTSKVKPANSKEKTLQSLIAMLSEEYGFEVTDMERDYQIVYEDSESGKNKRIKVDLAVFNSGIAHLDNNICRICIVQDEKTKETDKTKGTSFLELALSVNDDCEFGLWTNGDSMHFIQKETDAFDNLKFVDISDFPGEGQSMTDLERFDKFIPRKPANDSLVRTFRRCHDYLYGNQGLKKTAFWELLNLIFCKIYDEKRRFFVHENGNSYRREFWVGVREANTDEGRSNIARRIKGIFEKLKNDKLFFEVFDGNASINLNDKALAFIASELSKYSFLDASVDVKGLAYETIVSNTLKQEAGQFFTPRNIVKCMVDMLDPNENHRVLDPACGSGGFLVMVLDHVRRKITQDLYPELSGVYLADKFNSHEVNNLVKEYAERSIFGFDFDPDLKKAARMNMVMAGDGHANIFNVNSLAYPKGDNSTELTRIQEAIDLSLESCSDHEFSFDFPDARGKFDLVFTNPPFGSKIPINDPEILEQYDLGYNWNKDLSGNWQKGSISSSQPPEILFIEQCYKFLKPGGRMAIVVPDGILGNPNNEYVRAWILRKFILLASIDLAVEAFLPQVGVQASLLFLQRKTDKEIDLALARNEEYEVFMAIAEKLGKDRKGYPIYQRDEDGAELLFDVVKEYLFLSKDGVKYKRTLKERLRRIDDDLPNISLSFLQFRKGTI